MSIKRATGIVGLAVEPEARTILSGVYNQTLAVLSKMPASAGYRKHTETITKDRLAVVDKFENHEEIENQIDCGQIEEVIIQAKAELNLAEKMLNWEPWQPLENRAPPKQWQWPM
eukprot:CFRG4897T1